MSEQLSMDLWKPSESQAAVLDAIKAIDGKRNCKTATFKLKTEIIKQRLKGELNGPRN